MSDETGAAINKEYKDRLFNFIFGRDENREWTLSLYNAVNKSNYTDASVIEFNTLQDALYLGMRNDTSFLIADVMSVYEHQSSYNPNMPLRMLGYVDRLYSGYLTLHRLNKYGSTLVKLPIPKLVVFYNGSSDVNDEILLKLSDSFAEDRKADADIDVRVRMLNINFGRNNELMNKCKPLEEYASFIKEIRNNNKQRELSVAVRNVIKSMPDDYLLKEFLMIHMREVEEMLEMDYDAEEIQELFKEEGRLEGRQEGRDTRDFELISDMLKRGKTIDGIVEFCGYPVDLVERVAKEII